MKLKGYRTLILNTIAGAHAALELALPHVVDVLGMPELRGILPQGWLPDYALALALLNIWLRTITTTPVGRRETVSWFVGRRRAASSSSSQRPCSRRTGSGWPRRTTASAWRPRSRSPASRRRGISRWPSSRIGGAPRESDGF
ncbi:hypothetical protein [Pseudorhodobacter sp.]|uniref:hypothetical protein n=1 Tax=Pseudorhodobacter sp. TaxID=1934400 RepID=UPI002AFF2F44|nr:hypothetical protein [Pseudorhodobacter sp.]